MTPNELIFSWMLWLCIGFLIGYRYHIRKVRGDQAKKLVADVAVRCIEQPTDTRVN